MEKVAGVFKVLQNKYLLSIIVFIIWIAFCDRNDLFTQYERKQELNKLEASAAFYEQEIAGTRKELTDLNNDPAVLEKLAREKFFLKRQNEDIFIVTDSLDENN